MIYFELMKRIFSNPWTIGIGTIIIATIFLHFLFDKKIGPEQVSPADTTGYNIVIGKAKFTGFHTGIENNGDGKVYIGELEAAGSGTLIKQNSSSTK